MSSYFKNEKDLEGENKPNCLSRIINRIKTTYHALNDKALQYVKIRWYIIIFLALFYLFRLILTQGYQALTYCIGIHILNSFIGFISPMIDPEEERDNNLSIAQTKGEDFHPFQRKVKEYQFWETIFYTFTISNIITFFKSFDIPVFWPLLLFYFLLVFFFTMRQQIMQMLKYNYLPWDVGKVEYGMNI